MPFVPQSNGAQFQEAVDQNYIVSRQFQSEVHKEARLGTSSIYYTYEQFLNNTLNDPTMSMASGVESFEVNLFAGLDARVLKLQSTRAMENEENFKLACTWAWSANNESRVNLSWFLPVNSEARHFKNAGDIADSLDDLNTFLSVTFGCIWERCTLDLQEKLRRNHKLMIADPGYLRYKLEKLFAMFGGKLRFTDLKDKVLEEEGRKPEVRYGEFWSSVLRQMLGEFENSVSKEEEATWKALVCAKKMTGGTGAEKQKVVVNNPPKSIQEPIKDVCLKYLRNALGVVNPQTNLIPETCGKVDCERLHNEAFRKTKAQVSLAVQSAKGEKALVDAVIADPRFR
jgi:hypothetical protein